MIRPEVQNSLWRYRELIWAFGVAGIGLWLIWLGGLVLVPLGALVLAMATGLGVMALRRLRFAQTGEAPGVVDILEGQITYFGPTFGGAIALPDLVEIRLLTMQGRRLWRLKQADGQALLIPLDALGADRLFDAFASLPGVNMAAFSAALAPTPATGGGELALAAQTVTLWVRAGAGIMPQSPPGWH